MRFVRAGALVGLLLLAGCQAARLNPAPARHDFGTLLVGSNKRITPSGNWTNTGERMGRITGLTLGGSEAGAFAAEPALMRARVRPGERSPDVQALTFTPSRVGPHLATLAPTTADSDDLITVMGLRGEGVYIVNDGGLSVVQGAGAGIGLPDPDKPLDCGRIAYTTTVTCTFTVRNDTQNALAVVVSVLQGSVGGAFRISAPGPGPPATIQPNGTLTVTVSFTPPTMPPIEWMFMAGITVINVVSPTTPAGRTVCGVGFRPQDAPPTPPPGPPPAQLRCD